MAKNDSDSKIDGKYILKNEKVPDRNVYPSLGKFVLDKLESNVNFIGQLDCTTNEKYTYGKMRDRSVRCALWMKSIGLLPGDVVAVYSHNHLDIAIPCYAALYLGAVMNPLDQDLSRNMLMHLLAASKPRLAFTSEESATTIAEMAKLLKLDLEVIVFGRVTGFLEFENVISEPEIDEVKNFRCATTPTLDDIAVLLFTSGSTSLPKNVALSHGSLLRAFHSSWTIDIANNICLTFSPLCWITGVFFTFLHLLHDVTKIITPIFEEDSACALIEKLKVDWLFLSTPMINRLLKSDALYKYDISCLKCIHYGGASLTADFRKALAKLLPNTFLRAGYGLTELSGLVSIQSMDSKPDSCGKIVDNFQLKVIDPLTGRVLEANRRGEILLKSPNMMKCYYGNPQATDEVIDKDGWFHTGDIGYYDEDEEIFVTDKLKELIKYRGTYVSPSEIETVLLSHPGVNEVAVVGQPHPEDGEHPIAFVLRTVVETEKKVTEVELVDYVAARLSGSSHLRGGVIFVDRLSVSPSGKIRRQDLRDLAKSMRQELEAAG